MPAHFFVVCGLVLSLGFGVTDVAEAQPSTAPPMTGVPPRAVVHAHARRPGPDRSRKSPSTGQTTHQTMMPGDKPAQPRPGLS